MSRTHPLLLTPTKVDALFAYLYSELDTRRAEVIR